MSNEAITWAFKQELPMADKFVLVALADYADENNMCYPSHKKTAKRIGASIDTVKRATRRLQQSGYLEVIPWKRDNGSTTSNRYSLKVGVQPAPPLHSDTQGGYVDAPGAQCAGAPPINHQLEPPEELSIAKSESEDKYKGFDDFWDAYPRKIRKKVARERWAAAIKRETPETITRAAQVYAADCKANQREDKFIKYPEGWLTADSWNDYTEANMPKLTAVSLSWADAL